MGEKGNAADTQGAMMSDPPATQERARTPSRPKDPWEDPPSEGWKGKGPETWADTDETEMRSLIDSLTDSGELTKDQAGRFMDRYRTARAGRGR